MKVEKSQAIVKKKISMTDNIGAMDRWEREERWQKRRGKK